VVVVEEDSVGSMMLDFSEGGKLGEFHGGDRCQIWTFTTPATTVLYQQ
jgi:hypothetical protein